MTGVLVGSDGPGSTVDPVTQSGMHCRELTKKAHRPLTFTVPWLHSQRYGQPTRVGQPDSSLSHPYKQ